MDHIERNKKWKQVLRYSLVALMLLFLGRLDVETGASRSFALSVSEHLANVASMSASVPANPYNTLALQLDQKEKSLETRESALDVREQALDKKIEDAARANRMLTLGVLSAVTALLLLLIGLNFYFDIKREESHEEQDSPTEKEHEMSTRI